MAKDQLERTKPHVNVGTIGHVGSRENNANCCNNVSFCHRSLEARLRSMRTLTLLQRKRLEA